MSRLRRTLFSLCLTASLLFQAMPGLVPVFAEGESNPLWNHPSYAKKVNDIGQRILAANGITERVPFFVSESKTVNAYARRTFLTENTVVVDRGLLGLISNDDELAAVLSHEISHITERHGRKIRIRKFAARLAGYTTAGAIIFGSGGLLLPVAIPFLILPGRRVPQPYESEADLVGVDYMVKAGYNPMAMEGIMTKITGDGGVFARFFAAHPLGSERIGMIHQYIAETYPQYLPKDQLDNPIPGSPYEIAQTSPKKLPGKKSARNYKQRSREAMKTAKRLTAELEANAADSDANTVSKPDSTNPKAALPPTQKDETLNAEAQPGTQLAQTASVTNNKTQPTEPASSKDSHAALKQPESQSVVPKNNADEAKEIPKVAMARIVESDKNISKPAALPAPPAKSSHKPASALPAPPQKATAYSKKTPASDTVSRGEDSTADAPDTVALELLTLNPDQLKTIQLIRKSGYMNRADLLDYFPQIEPTLFTNQLNQLINKRLIRVVGVAPDDMLILTDRATEALK